MGVTPAQRGVGSVGEADGSDRGAGATARMPEKLNFAEIKEKIGLRSAE